MKWDGIRRERDENCHREAWRLTLCGRRDSARAGAPPSVRNGRRQTFRRMFSTTPLRTKAKHYFEDQEASYGELGPSNVDRGTWRRCLTEAKLGQVKSYPEGVGDAARASERGVARPPGRFSEVAVLEMEHTVGKGIGLATIVYILLMHTTRQFSSAAVTSTDYCRANLHVSTRSALLNLPECWMRRNRSGRIRRPRPGWCRTGEPTS